MSKRTPIKYDGNIKVVYVFLGDANLAMRLELRVVAKPSWYDKKVYLVCCVYNIQYAHWCGDLNMIHVPNTNRTHPLTRINFEGETYQNGGRSLSLQIDTFDDYEKPEIPEFENMSPLEVIKIVRCPIPKRLDFKWDINRLGVSTLNVSVVSTESGPAVDTVKRRRNKPSENELDDIYDSLGLANIT